MKKYFIFRIDWSQTDHEMVVILAPDYEAALTRVKLNNARYHHYYGEARFIEV